MEKFDEITEEVRKDLLERSRVGIRKYNTTLSENMTDNFLQHGYEEALDLAQYLKKEITIRKTVTDLVKSTPNDYELGEKIRRLFS